MSKKRLLSIITNGNLTTEQALMFAQVAERRIPSPGLLDAKETADLLKLTIGKVYEHARALTIPVFQIGRCYRFSKTELEEHFINKSKVA